MDHDLIHAQLGNYRLRRLLGRGGFAEVYLGEHVYLKTTAAIKLLRTEQQNMQDFVQEARLLASLRHPHIVSILEFDLYKGRPFLVMDYLPHGTLCQRFPHGSRLPVEAVLACLRQMAEALDYLHKRHLAHGDVKPENMLLGEQDQLYLSDFGIAILANKQQGQTLVGTINYMAPEQLQNQLQPASDQYALGVIAYEWLCGSPPFTGSYIEVATQHALTLPDPLHKRVPDLPADIEAVIMRALAKSPEQRFPSVGAFANAFENAYYGSLPTERRHPHIPTQLAPTVVSPQPASEYLSTTTQPGLLPNVPANQKPSRRSLLVSGSLGVAALALTGAGGLFWWSNQQTEHKPISKAQTPATVKPPPQQGSVYYIYQKQSGSIGTLAWSPDSKRIASSNISSYSSPTNKEELTKEHVIHVWDALTGQHPVMYQSHVSTLMTGLPWSPPLAWSPDSKYIVSSSATDKASMQVWESATGKPVASFERDYSTISQIYWREAGQILAICSTSGYIIRWNPFAHTNDVQKFSLADSDQFGLCSVSPDGKYIIVSGIGVYSLTEKRLISMVNVSSDGYLPEPYFWSPDSKRFVSLFFRLSPIVWDPLTGRKIAQFEKDSARIISWSPDSQKIVSFGDSGKIFIWDAATGKMLYQFISHDPLIVGIAWSPDGQKIANGGRGSIEVWQAV